MTGDMDDWAARSGFSAMEQSMGPESYANLLKHQEASLRISAANEEQIKAGTEQVVASTRAIEANIEISKAHAKKQDRIASFIGGYTALGAPFFVVACAAGCWGIWDWVLG